MAAVEVPPPDLSATQQWRELPVCSARTSLLEAAFRPRPQTPWTTQPVTAQSRGVRAGPFLPGQDASKGSSALVLYLPAEIFLRAALSLRLFPPFPSVFPLFIHRFQMDRALQRCPLLLLLPFILHRGLPLRIPCTSNSTLASPSTEHELTISSKGRLRKRAGR